MASILNNTKRLYILTCKVDGKLSTTNVLPGMNGDLDPKVVTALKKVKLVKRLRELKLMQLTTKSLDTGEDTNDSEEEETEGKKKKGKKK